MLTQLDHSLVNGLDLGGATIQAQVNHPECGFVEIATGRNSSFKKTSAV